MGAHFDWGDAGVLNVGSSYVFRYDPDEEEWVEEQKLRASDGERSDRFGHAVAVYSEMVLVGAPWADLEDTDNGAVYVFRYDPDAAEWQEIHKLTVSDAEEDDLLGSSIALYDETAVVSTLHNPVIFETFVESAYIFRLADNFLRGDVDGSGRVFALGDSLVLLTWAFGDGDEPPCLDAADADDSGEVSALVDALYLLRWAFSRGDVPPAPGPTDCGRDPVADGVDCESALEDCE